jgi:hypothetical protein
MMYAGMQVRIMSAQKQRRTVRDVRIMWLRPKVPSKRVGRKGTRRDWKRRNPPQWLYGYREPEDVLILAGHTIIATPRQAEALRQAIPVEKRA